jgi:hypothetical protein
MYQGTTVGDTLYWDGTNWVIVPAHVAATLALLRQTGTGSAGGVPTWDTTHGSAQHDSTVPTSKVREIFIPLISGWDQQTTSTSYVPGDINKWSFLYTAADWDLVTFYFEVGGASVDNGANTGTYHLYDATAGAEVTDSVLTTTSTSTVRLRSGPVTFTDGHVIIVQFKTSAGTAKFQNLRIIAVQSG